MALAMGTPLAASASATVIAIFVKVLRMSVPFSQASAAIGPFGPAVVTPLGIALKVFAVRTSIPAGPTRSMVSVLSGKEKDPAEAGSFEYGAEGYGQIPVSCQPPSLPQLTPLLETPM